MVGGPGGWNPLVLLAGQLAEAVGERIECGLQLVVFSSLDELDENGLAAYREAGGEA